MIPLSIFLVIWFVLLGIYVIASLLSIIQMLRFGVAGPMAVFSTVVFLAVAGLVIVGTGLSLFAIDWSTTLDINLLNSPYLAP